jgi:hypothetical protein
VVWEVHGTAICSKCFRGDCGNYAANGEKFTILIMTMCFIASLENYFLYLDKYTPLSCFFGFIESSFHTQQDEYLSPT